MDGSPVVFTAWNQNEPNFANNDENCVTMYKSMGKTTSSILIERIGCISKEFSGRHGIISFSGFWNDINCGVQLPSICKRNVNFITSTAAPTTVPRGGCGSDWTSFQGKVGEFTFPKMDFQRYFQKKIFLPWPLSVCMFIHLQGQ